MLFEKKTMRFILVLIVVLIPFFSFAADPETKEREFFLGRNMLKYSETECLSINTHTQRYSPLRAYNSDSIINANSKFKKKHSISLFDKIIKKKQSANDIKNHDLCSCNALHDDVRINIFKADLTGREEYFTFAMQSLTMLEKEMKKPNASFPERLPSHTKCYYRILICGKDKDLRNYQDEYEFAIEGLELSRIIYNKALQNNEELFNHIEEILGVSGLIFQKGAQENEKSLQALEGVIKTINMFRTKRLKEGLPFMSVIDLNSFDKTVQDIRLNRDSLIEKKDHI